MQIVIPSGNGELSWRVRVNDVASQTNLIPFHRDTIFFLDSLSKSILLDRSMRGFPEIMAAAHWLRKSHLLTLKTRFQGYAADRYLKARGMVIHFAPANVDSVFIYSWVVSMLSGNKNIIRLSRRSNLQTDVLFDKIDELLNKEEFAGIRNRMLLVRYNHEEEYTKYLSHICQLRVIWGGDSSVKSIRSCPLPANSLEIVFPNRYSKALLHAESILNASEETMVDVAKKFYNDSLWFGQLACSSPREIFWLGATGEIIKAKERFWYHVNKTVEKEGYTNEPNINVLRMTASYFYAAQPDTLAIQTEAVHSPVRIDMGASKESFLEVHSGGGLFLEYQISEIEELSKAIHERDQTLSYWGISREELLRFADHVYNRGIDRIVPFGQALQFDSTWDGYDLFVYFTREIVIQ